MAAARAFISKHHSQSALSLCKRLFSSSSSSYSSSSSIAHAPPFPGFNRAKISSILLSDATTVTAPGAVRVNPVRCRVDCSGNWAYSPLKKDHGGWTPGINVRMTVTKRYVLRLFISLKYITANVVDRNNGRIVATASTVEHAIKSALECGRSCNAKAAAVVGEVLAMRLKVEGLDQGQGRGIHADVNKEIEKKGFKSQTKGNWGWGRVGCT